MIPNWIVFKLQVCVSHRDYKPLKVRTSLPIPNLALYKYLMNWSDHMLLLELRINTLPLLCQHKSNIWVLHLAIHSVCLVVNLIHVMKYLCLSLLPLQIPDGAGISPLALSVLQALSYSPFQYKHPWQIAVLSSKLSLFLSWVWKANPENWICMSRRLRN